MVQSILEYYECYSHNQWVFKDVYVNFSRMYYVLGGSATYQEVDSGLSVTLQKGHLYFFPVKKAFNLFDDDGNKLNHTYLHILTNPPITEFVDIDCQNDSFLSGSIELLRKFIKTVEKDKVLRLAELITSYVFERLVKNNSSDTVMERLKKNIDSNPEAAFNLNRLTRIYGYSASQIIVLFKKKYGITPINYYNNKKMEHAIHLFSKNIPINAVAAQLNYSSLSNFSRAFKIKFGMSPQLYIDTFLTQSTIDSRR